MAYFRCTTGGSGKGNTLVVTCADDLAGATITCTNGTKTYRKTCPSTAPYEVTFYGLEAGTWTLSATVSGNTYTATVVITDCAALLGGFNWRTWVDTAQFLDSSDYDSLDEVLADELAVRELCLEHACVDYLADIATANEDVETIINNDLFAKWVNNSDYSLDVLGANVAIKALMDTADKYGYGEWCLMPQVPTMTANDAPYGEASASSVYSSNFLAYKAFDGTTSNAWISQDTRTVGEYVDYTFTSAKCIKEIKVGNAGTISQSVTQFKILGSNDRFSNYDELGTFTNSDVSTTFTTHTFKLNNDNSYLSYRLVVNGVNGGTRVEIPILQFYAYAPKGNVPIMTANNAPYGVASTNGAQASSNPAWYAFDGNENTQANLSSSAANGEVIFKFTNPISVRRFRWMQNLATAEETTLQVSYSDDGTNYTNAGNTHIYLTTDNGNPKDFNIAEFGFHLYWKVKRTRQVGGVLCNTLQFYGRELKVSVPKMDSATPPFGSLIYNIDPQNDNRPWYAFDNNSATAAMTTSANQVPFRIGYDFGKLVRVAYLAYIPLKSGESYSLTSHTDTFYYSVDGTTWNVLATNEVTNANAKQINLVSFDPVLCKAVKYETDTPTMSNGFCSMSELLIFGKDYSEKEFEEGTTKKWLYDHGVELETMYTVSATKNADCITLTAVNAEARTLSAVDFSLYNLLRGKVGSHASGTAKLREWVAGAYSDWTTSNMPYANALDVSSVNGQHSAGALMSAAGTFDVSELWLE